MTELTNRQKALERLDEQSRYEITKLTREYRRAVEAAMVGSVDRATDEPQEEPHISETFDDVFYAHMQRTIALANGLHWDGTFPNGLVIEV